MLSKYRSFCDRCKQTHTS